MENKKLTIEFKFKGVKKKVDMKRKDITLDSIWKFIKSLKEWNLDNPTISFKDHDGNTDLEGEEDVKFMLDNIKSKKVLIIVDSVKGFIGKSKPPNSPEPEPLEQSEKPDKKTKPKKEKKNKQKKLKKSKPPKKKIEKTFEEEIKIETDSHQVFPSVVERELMSFVKDDNRDAITNTIKEVLSESKLNKTDVEQINSIIKQNMEKVAIALEKKQKQSEKRTQELISNFFNKMNESLQPKEPSIIRSNLNVIHKGYNCDECGTEPIKGARYSCSECDDYDCCEPCLITKGHEHNMIRIVKNINEEFIITSKVENKKEDNKMDEESVDNSESDEDSNSDDDEEEDTKQSFVPVKSNKDLPKKKASNKG